MYDLAGTTTQTGMDLEGQNCAPLGRVCRVILLYFIYLNTVLYNMYVILDNIYSLVYEVQLQFILLQKQYQVRYFDYTTHQCDMNKDPSMLSLHKNHVIFQLSNAIVCLVGRPPSFKIFSSFKLRNILNLPKLYSVIVDLPI